jgi:hypothetical protein
MRQHSLLRIHSKPRDRIPHWARIRPLHHDRPSRLSPRPAR